LNERFGGNQKGLFEAEDEDEGELLGGSDIEDDDNDIIEIGDEA
jgi:hypothetical protein